MEVESVESAENPLAAVTCGLICLLDRDNALLYRHARAFAVMLMLHIKQRLQTGNVYAKKH